MMFFKLAFYDIKNALLQEWKKLLFFPVGIAAICIAFYATYAAELDTIKGTFGDYWLYIFGGMKECKPGNAFAYPAVWTIVVLYLLYITLYYPYNDLLGYGQNVLTRSHGRMNWWLSKCVWNFVTILACFLSGAFVVALFCALFGSLSTEISEGMYTDVFKLLENQQSAQLGFAADAGDAVFAWPKYINTELFLMPLLTVTAVSQLQMLVSLWIRPAYGFCAMVAFLVTSAYYLKPFMIGNYAMAIRFERVVSVLGGNYVSPAVGVGILTAFTVGCVIIGLITFRHYDILNKEN